MFLHDKFSGIFLGRGAKGMWLIIISGISFPYTLYSIMQVWSIFILEYSDICSEFL